MILESQVGVFVLDVKGEHVKDASTHATRY